ncbi:MAG TPA: hypothetical protein VMW38_27450, partial [Terriglobia bacterium]|nr:hypothetical protein [Terriglobia bacterium]
MTKKPLFYLTLYSFLLAVLSYYLCLRFIHPGYFNPLYPHHVDFYGPPGMAYDLENWRSYITWARPVGFGALFVVGQFGLGGSILALTLICLLNSALTVSLVRRMTGEPVSVFAILLFFFSIFSHPYFYWNYRHDLFATLSFGYLISAMHLWWAFQETKRRWHLIACAALITAMCFTKETYMVSLVVLWIFQIWIIKAETRRTAAWLLAFSILSIGVSILFQVLGGSAFVNPKADSASAYAIDFNPSSIAGLYWSYLKTLFNPATALLVLFSFLCNIGNTKRMLHALMFLCMGLAAYLPNAVLPHHFLPKYSWVGATFCFGVTLFVPSSVLPRVAADRLRLGLAVRPTITVVLLSLLAYFGWRGNDKHYAATRWIIDQEVYNRNILNSFPKLRMLPLVTTNILVAGLDGPFHPFLVPPFICRELGDDRRWTVAIPDDQDVRKFKSPIHFKRDCVQYLQVSHVDLTTYDYAVGFSNTGILVQEYDGSRLGALGGITPGHLADCDSVLFPSLKDIRQKLKGNSSDWPLWQE